MNTQVLLAPFPLDLSAAFAYFMYQRAGILKKGAYVRYKTRAKDDPTGFLGNKSVLNLGSPQHLYNDLTMVVAARPQHTERRLLQRMLTYCAHAHTRTAFSDHYWLAEAAKSHSPNTITGLLENRFGFLEENRCDVWDTGLGLQELELPHEETLSGLDAWPLGKRYLRLPVVKRVAEIDQSEKTRIHLPLKIVSTHPYELVESRIWPLVGKSVSIVVGGPPGSGKSTLVASLASELDRIISTLKSRGFPWSYLPLETVCTTLDYSTPVVPTIAKTQNATDQVALQALKREWTNELAREALTDFIAKQKSSRILLADLPGKVTSITETVCAAADLGIIIAKDWDLKAEWTQFFNRMKVPVVSQVKSRDQGNFLPSVVTKYDPGKFISGRVVGLERVNKPWDNFISWLAELLLFDILPSRVEEREAKIAAKILGLQKAA